MMMELVFSWIIMVAFGQENGLYIWESVMG